MPMANQQEFIDRCELLPDVEILSFESHIEFLMENALAVVAMGGYNTFCEILSLDKPALIIPRSVPRREQLIRTLRAEKIGLVSYLDPDSDRDPMEMADKLKTLPDQSPPSSHSIDNLMLGHQIISERITALFDGDPLQQQAI